MGSDKGLRKTFKEWEEGHVAKTLAKFPERKERFETLSGIPVNRLYSPSETALKDYGPELGFPGMFPFTRGVQPTMYRGRFWTMRQYSGFATAKETNERFKFLLGQGQTGLSIAFDLPTQIGYDSDNPLAQGEVGKVGVAIDSLADMELLFDGIPLDKVSTSMTINAPAAILLAMYIAVGEKQGVAMNKLRGTIQNDILKEYVARGTWVFGPNPSLRITTDIMEYCAKHLPLWNPLSISGYHIREAGSTAVQEIAFTLLNGMAYVQAGIDSGLDVDSFAPRLSFFFNAHNDILEEVAKFRAARRMWAYLMREKMGAKDSRSWKLRFHTQTAGCSLTSQQPMNNVVRVAYQALAAILGGTQSLHTNSMDEALCLPTEDAVRVALRTQQILAHESGIANTIDPLGGSYYVESLTNQLEEAAYKYFDQVESMGGVVRAIEKGFFQREIAESAYKYQLGVDAGQRTVVGVNDFIIEDEELKIPVLQVDKEIECHQVERVKLGRRKRDNKKVLEYLDDLRQVSTGTENVMPSVLKAVRAHATVGEIMHVWREVYGEWNQSKVL